jgi:ribosomal RNA-processing protein 9
MSSRNSARKRSAPSSGARRGGKSNRRQPAPQSDRRSKNDDSNINWEYDSDQLASDDDGQTHNARPGDSVSDDEVAEAAKETAQEKRARMAKEYIDELRAQGLDVDQSDEDDGSASDGSGDEDDVQGHDAEFRRTSAAAKLTASGAGSHAAINAHLQRDVLRAQGRLRSEAAQQIGDALARADGAEFKQYKGHRLPATCVALSESEEFAITGSKDAGLIRWDVETGKKVTKFPGRMKRKTDDEDSLAAIGGHSDEVLCCALSSDDRYLATGGRDNLINIWDVRSSTLIDRLQGHRDGIMGL